MSSPSASVPDSPENKAHARWKQPPGLFLLAGVEMWERFSYYGMRAFLVFFLTSGAGFGWSKTDANTLYGWYTGLVYLTPLLGGYLADRVLGTHRAMLIGSFVISFGHFALAVPGKVTFFLGLALIILGTGFHKSNISTMVGQLYGPGDARRDSAFTIFHMGINVGAMLGPLVCGGLAESPRFGWHWGFASAGVCMVIGTVVYIALKRRLLGKIGDVPAAKAPRDVSESTSSAKAPVAPNAPLTALEKDRILAIVILAIFNIFFWAAYEQTGTSMNFFARERTDLEVFGFTLAASSFQSINPIAILIFAPVFALLWPWLEARGRNPSTPTKFAIGITFVSLGFVIMVMAAQMSEGGHKVSPLWLVSAYVLHTWGELCLYPISLSMVTKLAPQKYQSLLMGVWFGSFFICNLAAGAFAGQLEKIESGQVFRLFGGQADFFLILVIVPAIAALVLMLIRRRITGLMHGVR
jgi:POT family proton-dependent oligopeptide transporter